MRKNKFKLLIIILTFALFNKSYSENYIENISEISKLAENTVNAATKQISSDTDKVLKNLETKLRIFHLM